MNLNRIKVTTSHITLVTNKKFKNWVRQKSFRISNFCSIHNINLIIKFNATYIHRREDQKTNKRILKCQVLWKYLDLNTRAKFMTMSRWSMFRHCEKDNWMFNEKKKENLRKLLTNKVEKIVEEMSKIFSSLGSSNFFEDYELHHSDIIAFCLSCLDISTTYPFFWLLIEWTRILNSQLIEIWNLKISRWVRGERNHLKSQFVSKFNIYWFHLNGNWFCIFFYRRSEGVEAE